LFSRNGQLIKELEATIGASQDKNQPKPISVAIDTKKLFNLDLTDAAYSVKINAPSGPLTNPIDIKKKEDGTFLLTFVPVGPGRYTILIYKGEEVVGKLETSLGASAGSKISFTLDTQALLGTLIDLTEAQYEVQVTGPKGKIQGVEVVKKAEGVFEISFLSVPSPSSAPSTAQEQPQSASLVSFVIDSKTLFPI